MDRGTINTILALTVPFILTASFALYLRHKNRRYEEAIEVLRLTHAKEEKEKDERIERMEETVKRVEVLELGHATLTANAVPINAAFQALLIKQLTHMHTPVLDDLLVKLGTVDTPPTITDEEEVKLAILLKERTKDMGPEISAQERDAATILPTVIKMVRREAEAVAAGTPIVDVQLVGSLPHTKE